MKTSKYTYAITDKVKVTFYNGITEKFFSVPLGRKDVYEEIMKNPDSYSQFDSFLTRLKESGFILDDQVDEIDAIKAKYHQLRRPWQYSIMILPTYQCNVRCWYCIQKHQNLWITPEVIESVKKRILSKLEDPEITHLNLAWFGGEPLLAYDVVLSMTRFAREAAEKAGKSFSCDITTNSTLLTSERIKELKEAGVSSYQITIDGPKDVHDTIKVLKDKSAFETALSNINEIAQHSSVTLRFNYTADNLKYAEQILEDIKARISKDARSRIRFLLCRVWQENADSIDNDRVEMMYDKGRQLGFTSSVPFMDMCYADQYGFECVLPNGLVGKCDNDELDKMPGQLDKEGDINWKDEYQNFRSTVLENKDAECYNCRYLPICWGPCPKHRGEDISRGIIPPCKFLDKDTEMHEILKYRLKEMDQ